MWAWGAVSHLWWPEWAMLSVGACNRRGGQKSSLGCCDANLSSCLGPSATPLASSLEVPANSWETLAGSLFLSLSFLS